MRTIKGTTIEEQLVSIDAALTRLSRPPMYLADKVQLYGMRGYRDKLDVGEVINDIIPSNGKIVGFVVVVGKIPNMPGEQGKPRPKLSVEYEEGPGFWTQASLQISEGKQELTIQIEAQRVVKVGSRVKITSDRLIEGLWYVVKLEPSAKLTTELVQ